MVLALVLSLGHFDLGRCLFLELAYLHGYRKVVCGVSDNFVQVK